MDSGLLRLRHREFVADPSDPFKNDVLGREPQIRAFCAVLAGIEAPAVLSLDGGWGTGKTAFVRMCSALMRSEASPHSDVAAVEFNAWTEGYTDEPLKDIVEAVTSQITDADDQRRKKTAQLLELQAARVATSGMVPDGIVADGEGPRRDTLRFKKTLRSFVTDSGGRLVVFIDELDRCRPDYAVGVLEKVRHIFDVAGVVVVLAVNREALEHAVGGLHGSKEAAERYMRRFVDQATHLTDPSDDTTIKFLEHLYQETGISSRMKRNNYRRLMFEALARPEHSSLRDLEQAVHRAAFVLASIPRASDDDSDPMWAWEQTAMTLMILREVNRGGVSQIRERLRGRVRCRPGPESRSVWRINAECHGSGPPTNGAGPVAGQAQRHGANAERPVLESLRQGRPGRARQEDARSVREVPRPHPR